MRIDKTTTRGMIVVLGLAVAACATVADLEVSRAAPDSVDRDDPKAPPVDAATAPDGAVIPPPGDGGPAADTGIAPPPTVCMCPAGEGCCATQGAAVKCTPGSGAASCTANGGFFIHCSGGDVANGRVCCFTKDVAGTFYAASCADAGAQICTDETECTSGTCESTTCRGASLKACGPMGQARPACMP